jgi:outer membrane protein with beta-barrel domain
MKITSILIICIFIISSNLFAQDKFNYGLKIGMVDSEFSVDKKEISTLFIDLFNDNRKGPVLGIFTDYKINNAFNLDFEFLYLQKGAEDEIEVTTEDYPDGIGETVSYDIQLDYLQINASINPKLNFKRIELQGKFGLSISMLIENKSLFYFKDADDISTGYLFGGKLIFNDILKNPFYIEIIRNTDFNPFYKTDSYKITNEIWMFNLGFYYN